MNLTIQALQFRLKLVKIKKILFACEKMRFEQQAAGILLKRSSLELGIARLRLEAASIAKRLQRDQAAVEEAATAEKSLAAPILLQLESDFRPACLAEIRRLQNSARRSESESLALGRELTRIAGQIAAGKERQLACQSIIQRLEGRICLGRLIVEESEIEERAALEHGFTGLFSYTPGRKP